MINSPAHSIIAHDTAELKRIVEDIVFKEGPRCDLNRIDVSRITSMNRLFQDSPFDGDISQWDVSNVADFWGMFLASSFSGDISNWCTKNALDMGNMFHASTFAGDISRWDTSRVESLGQMFHNNKNFQGDVSRWNISGVRRFDHLFYESNWRGDLSAWRPHHKATEAGIVGPYEMKAMAAPTVFHWKLFLGKPDQYLPEDVLASDWLVHFNRVQHIVEQVAQTLRLSYHDTAQMYQDSWLQAQYPEACVGHLPLPDLDI